MSRGERILPALCVGVAAMQLGLMTGAYAMVAIVVSPALVALVVRRRFALSVPAEMLVLISCGLAGFALTTIVPLGAALASEPMRAAPAALALAALLFAGIRLFIEDPQWGLAGTLGIGLAVFLACGTVQSGRLFPLALTTYGLLAFAALAANGVASGERQQRRKLDRRHLAASALLILLAMGLSASLAGAIPALYHAAYRWALDRVDHRVVSGFHDGALPLGALRGMLQSDEIVARVEGDAGEHLRGNVYQVYQRGRWLAAQDRDDQPMRVAEIVEPGPGEPPVQAVVRYASDDLDRFFLPVVDGKLQLEPPEVRVDRFGVVRTSEEQDAAARVVLLPGDQPTVSVAPPSSLDTEVPDSIAPALQSLVGSWVDDDEQAGRALVDALRRQLEARYVYSLEVPELQSGAGGAADPILGFLLDHNAGHCEYFASAMTLLVRSAGLPARLVTGYRIAEYNDFGGYFIVRERHAHAWTEVHLSGVGWVTVDPSPLSGTSIAGSDRTALLPGLVDYASVLVETWGAELLLVVMVFGLAGIQLRRIFAGRGEAAAVDAAALRPPPRYLSGLLSWLEQCGLARRTHEPLEAFARRIHRVEESTRIDAGSLREASLLLQRYAALRYGDIGSGELLQGEFDGWVEQQRG